MRATLMHNPGAGYSQPPREALMRALRAAGYEAAYRSTKADDLTDALQDPGDLVVVAGGDGTVGKIARLLAGSSVPMAILPLGTANNIAVSLGIGGSLEEMVTGWARATRVHFRLGMARGPWGERAFVESIGGGFFVLGMREAERAPEEAFSGREERLQWDRRVLRSVLERCTAREWRLDLDGDDLSGCYLLVEAMTTGLVGPNLRLAPSADPGDGLLRVVVVDEAHRAALLASLSEGAASPPELPVHAGTALRILGWPSPLHVDDELCEGGDREVEASRREEAVEVPVSRNS
jgi:diacylglycerol kinase (ATP)